MAKILITPLGRGNKNREYSSAEYRFDETKNVYKTNFIAAALAQEIKPDKIIYVGTSKSMWEEVYKYFSEKAGAFDENEYFKIAEFIENNERGSFLTEELVLSIEQVTDIFLRTHNPLAVGNSKVYSIKYGIDQKEIWENFDTFMMINQEIEVGDEIYLDITHSFRSIPIFMYLMLDFISTLNIKNIKLSGVYYGMLDISPELGYTPVVDLKVLFAISHWVKAAHSFINYGNGYLIAERINNEEVKKKIRNITELLQLNSLVELQTQIRKLSKELNKVGKPAGTVEEKAFAYVLPSVRNLLIRLSDIEDSSLFQLELSKWFFENHYYSNGYICLAEAIITKLCIIYGCDYSLEKDRKKIKTKVLSSKVMNYNNSKEEEKVYLYKLYIFNKKISKIRNRCAHGSFRNSSGSFRSEIDRRLEYNKEAYQLLNDTKIYKIPEIQPIAHE